MSVDLSDIVRRDKTITQRPGMIGMIDGLEAAWNAHDLDGVMAFFADDAILEVKPPVPGRSGRYTGKDEIRTFMERHIPGAQVAGEEHELVGGDRASWAAIVTNDFFTELGVVPAKFSAEARIMRGRITGLMLTFREETRKMLEQVGKSGATETPTAT
jgi:hypothetical protein